MRPRTYTSRNPVWPRIAPLAVLTAFSPALDAPAFRPEAGTTLGKTFSNKGTFELDDLSIIV